MKNMRETNICYSPALREEELKNKVAADWFDAFDCTRIIGNVDFCVDIPATELALGFAAEPMLWAEAKAGNRKDIVASFVQLILTIGGQHTADKNLPPHFLGAFDAEKIAFLPYDAVLDVFGKNDFDWTVTPSDHETKEFAELYELARGVVEKNKLLFRFAEDADALRHFIKANFKSGRRDISKILINKNNFTHIYRQWRETVMPFIDAPWDVLKKKYVIYDRDFYLAEMNIDDNGTVDIADDRVANDFYITFDAKSSTPYTVKRKNEDDLFATLAFGFNPGGIDAYAAFWRRYKRPPRRDYWNFIVNRLDLLVPQDVRERKGSFFTPKKWVELSQHYLELELGENWQDDYYIWDCCAGTGNLLAGLTNKYKIWASTLDQQDVDVMRERAKNGANLLESHIFQFDFLNDSFDKLPRGLKEIIDDPEKRKRLVIYINPPYAEHSNRKVIVGTGDNRTNVARDSKVYREFSGKVGTATRELYVQFFLRIYNEIPSAVLGSFSTMKFVCSQNCALFRSLWHSSFGRGFICPADTFDNVKGAFPVAFTIWHLGEGDEIRRVNVDVVDRTAQFMRTKTFHASIRGRMISDWLRRFYDKDTSAKRIAYMSLPGVSMQQRASLFITSKPTESDIQQHKVASITPSNLIPFAVYLAVRHCIEPTWENNKEEFLWPDDEWNNDVQFKADCLVWSLFDNTIKSRDGVNHWIPFSEEEVGAQDCYASHFMSDFINGREIPGAHLVNPVQKSPASLRLCVKENLTPASRAVLDAGRELWRYYHAQPGANPNASFYDIRLHFQGASVDARGKRKMNSASADATYTKLLGNLRAAMKTLARQIEPKVYDYGFLRR